MKRRAILFLPVLLLLCCACGRSAASSEVPTMVQTSLGHSYELADYTGEECSSYFSRLNLNTATAQELQDASPDHWSGQSAGALDTTYAAAEAGAEILDGVYDNWSETKTVIVEENKEAQAYVVSGQMKDRMSTAGIGTVVLRKEDGAVLYLGLGMPET